MPLGLVADISVLQRAFETPLWAERQGLMRARWPMLPRATGWYNLYRGVTCEMMDWDAPVGQAGAGQAEIQEFAPLHPTGTGTYVYSILGASPGGQESAPHDSAFFELEYLDGVRVPPPPATPLSFAAAPYRGGPALFTVVVDQGAGRAPAAALRCYNDGGTGGGVNYGAQVGPDVPVAAGGRHTLRFIVDPGLPHGTWVQWSVRCVSVQGAEEANTRTVSMQIDSQGPPALSGIRVEIAA